jgi:hypothetical protein
MMQVKLPFCKKILRASIGQVNARRREHIGAA